MSGWTLRLRARPALRIDLRGVTPTALAALSAAEVNALPLAQGRDGHPLGDLFHVEARSDDKLVLAGDLSRVDRVGWQMDGGELIVEGSVGHYAGAAMRAGTLHVQGDAADLAACELAGGRLIVDGSVGDFAAGTLPGSMGGMRGGELIVRGNAGARFGDRLRRGTAIVFGSVGDFAASRMVAGTIAIGGRVGAHCGYGMRRGSVVFAGTAPEPSATFVPAITESPVFWQLLARDLARHGGVFADLARRRTQRWMGDLAADGQGEWLIVR